MATRNKSEFARAPLGDERLQRRLEAIGNAITADPDASFPNAMSSESELEALYRFLNNPRVTDEAIVQPHVEATIERMANRDVIVVHDTTNFVFSGPPGDSLGFIPTTTQRGFVGHFALAVDHSGAALGVLGLETLFFETRIRGVIRRNKSQAAMMYARRKDKASLRWDRMVERTRDYIPVGARAVHVMDREADNYRLYDLMVQAGDRFVVRVRHERRPARQDDVADWDHLSEVAKLAPYRLKRTVALSRRRRRPGLNATHDDRAARSATLEISATSVTLRKPGKGYPDGTPSISLNVVRVHEVKAPAGTEAVDWLLLTTKPVETRADVERVVDTYRHRWVIEEYFRALKTGCAYERRQLESRDALLRTLYLLVPIAWQLLALRDAARAHGDEPAASILRPAQIAVLRGMGKHPLPESPSLQAALLAIAAQGGHLKRNGPPGWQTLGRGIEKLWWAEFGYQLALQSDAKK